MIPRSSLVILYGVGGLSDVGRHAVLAALDAGVESIRVLTQHPELLELPNWKCSCPTPHSFTEAERRRIRVVPVKDWQDEDEYQTSLQQHFRGADAVVSCLGNRQPGLFEPELKQGWVAAAGNAMAIRAMQQHGVQRVVAVSSVGVEEDWPPMEFFWIAKVILSALFVTPGLVRKAFWDLTHAERAYRQTDSRVDFLIVRPVGLGDEVVPVGTWQLQKEKYKDTVGGNMAKMDCARYMVQEALKPTKHRTAVVIGAVEEEEEEAAGESTVDNAKKEL